MASGGVMGADQRLQPVKVGRYWPGKLPKYAEEPVENEVKFAEER